MKDMTSITVLPSKGMYVVFSLLILLSGLNIMTNMITLLYMGYVMTEDKPIDPKDWKRRWIIFFAWFRLILVSLIIAFSGGKIIFIPFINLYLLLSLFTSGFTLSYVGLSFDTVSEMDPLGWKRRWVILFSWINMVTSGVQFLSLFIPYIVQNFYYNVYESLHIDSDELLQKVKTQLKRN